MKRILLWIVLALTTQCFAAEDDARQTWVSPNHRFAVHHAPVEKIPAAFLADPNHQGEIPAVYTLTAKGAILWSAESLIDESAHSFRCIWAADSASALILDRPDRGTVEITLVRTSPEARGTALQVQRLIDRAMTRAGDTEWRHLQKAWLGEWRFTKGHYEGVLVVARARYHRFLLTLDPSQQAPALKVADQENAEKWSDIREKL